MRRNIPRKTKRCVRNLICCLKNVTINTHRRWIDVKTQTVNLTLSPHIASNVQKNTV